jgi:hypothetical protein
MMNLKVSVGSAVPAAVAVARKDSLLQTLLTDPLAGGLILGFHATLLQRLSGGLYYLPSGAR